MRGKKLLTLGCVMAILAFGACFTPPPRIRVNLQGSRRILVRVGNNSDTRHVDPAVLGPCIAREVNSDLRGKATATAGGDANPGDIVLEVTITKEEADERPFESAKVTRWGFDIWLSAILKRSDGTAIWSRSYRQYHGFVHNTQLTGPWDSAAFANALPSAVCYPLASQVVYNEP